MAACAKSGEGAAELAGALESHWTYLKSSGEGRARLKTQHAAELQFWIQRRVLKTARDRVTDTALEEMVSHKIDPASLGRRILKTS